VLAATHDPIAFLERADLHHQPQRVVVHGTEVVMAVELRCALIDRIDYQPTGGDTRRRYDAPKASLPLPAGTGSARPVCVRSLRTKGKGKVAMMGHRARGIGGLLTAVALATALREWRTGRVQGDISSGMPPRTLVWVVESMPRRSTGTIASHLVSSSQSSLTPTTQS
jgi:hypothetical protein